MLYHELDWGTEARILTGGVVTLAPPPPGTDPVCLWVVHSEHLHSSLSSRRINVHAVPLRACAASA